MALRLRGSTSGFVEIDAPAVAGDVTLTLPSTAGTVNVKDTSGNTEVGTGVTLGNPSADIFTISNIGGERLRIASDGTVTIPGVVNIDSAVTIGSSLNVAGVLTYEDVTSVDAIGLSTFRDGLNTKDVGMIDIDTSISDTAVDVFVYDTSKDSDGGEWRKRTTNTSWYNETLNTATRGSRREFPAVAVIVSESDKVTIYDGDDPDLPMWMVFNGTGTWNQGLYYNANTSGPLYALNGTVAWGDANSAFGLITIDFIKEFSTARTASSSYGGFSNVPLVNRNSTSAATFSSNTYTHTAGVLVNNQINDVAMTVLPNAPIDDTTGLPVPTIAAGTDGGLSVIRDDGTIFDIVYTSNPETISVSFNTIGNINFLARGNSVQFVNVPVPSQDYSSGTAGILVGLTGGSAYHTGDNISGNPQSAIIGSAGETTNQLSNASGGPSGLTFISNETPTGYSQGAVAYATTSYNTGWMHGDIKGAFLSDTSTDDVTASSNLIDNGDFGTGDFTNWSIGGTTTPTISSGGALLTTGAVDGAIWQSTSGEATSGKWLITWTVTSNIGGYFGLYLNNSGPNIDDGTLVQDNILADGGYFYEGNITSVEFRHRGSGSGIVDNITLTRVVEEDRSVNNKGLQVFGTITKEPVVGTGATAADLVGYSGWSGSNYLYQPYNSDLDFTDEMSIMLWVKGWESQDNLLHRGPGTTRNSETSFLLYCDTGYDYRFTLSSDGSTEQNFEISLDNNAVGWQHLCFTLSGKTVRGFLNGEEKVLTNSNFTGGNIYSQATAQNGLYIGINGPVGSESPVNAYLSLLRLSATVPSTEQIKKIYEDEKVLFQESSKCTLYGSSDAVTALAYDEVTDQLHVGTSSGRSDFLGLRRINNTTVGITTAISAHDTFIVEQ